MSGSESENLYSKPDGERYRKLQANHSKIVAGYIKENNQLKIELAKAHAETVNVRNIWFEQCDSDWEKYQAELNKKEQKIQKLMDEKWELLKASDDKIAALTKYDGAEGDRTCSRRFRGIMDFGQQKACDGHEQWQNQSEKQDRKDDHHDHACERFDEDNQSDCPEGDLQNLQ
ncbi:MAG: hypothetical protein LUG99_21615 [Lachnospiraceae bacterium]|nr:hypothetical protein [Lachnospiraceae bacterium]